MKNFKDYTVSHLPKQNEIQILGGKEKLYEEELKSIAKEFNIGNFYTISQEVWGKYFEYYKYKIIYGKGSRSWEGIENIKTVQDLKIEEFAVDQYGKGNYKAFKALGDSMNGGGIDDTKDGATVLARELGRQHWKDGFNDTEYGWIILCKENIFHKDIVDYDSETGDITLHSRNKSPEYSDFTINLNDCYQIFKVIKRTF